jgi:23S rRNA (adenine2030-N6)-methyltransferase
MNYRHAYHAGNHTEVFKHAVLVALLEHLRLKPAPFMVLDTHAGIGIYDLLSGEALKTMEADAGIRRVASNSTPSLKPYLDLVDGMNSSEVVTYPGSPEIVRRLLRDKDRLIACELHPADALLLKATFRGDRRVAVHHRNGYEAVRAFCPPPERRGLVFIDPPFERTDEAQLLVRALADGVRKWPTGIFAAWYPIKGRLLGMAIAEQVKVMNIRPTIVAEFTPFARSEDFLSGSGILICNPPWKIDDMIKSICSDLLSIFSNKEGKWHIDWIVQ